MGDFRATIKIEFEMGDVKDQTSMWINWSPSDEYGGIDERVGSWIADRAEELLRKSGWTCTKVLERPKHSAIERSSRRLSEPDHSKAQTTSLKPHYHVRERKK